MTHRWESTQHQPGKRQKANAMTTTNEQIHEGTEQVVQEQVKVVLSTIESEALKAASGVLKAEDKLSDKVAALIVEYTVRGIPVSEFARHWQDRTQATGVWLKANGEDRFLNTKEARDYAFGRVYNTLAARKGKLVVGDDGIAVLTEGKVSWVETSAEPEKRSPKQPSAAADDKGPLPAPPEQMAREAAAADKARHQAVGSIAAQVAQIRRKLEVLRPLIGDIVTDLGGHLDQIVTDLGDMAECDGLRRAEIEAERDRILKAC